LTKPFAAKSSLLSQTSASKPCAKTQYNHRLWKLHPDDFEGGITVFEAMGDVDNPLQLQQG
jgi:hypothetical protein